MGDFFWIVANMLFATVDACFGHYWLALLNGGVAFWLTARIES